MSKIVDALVSYFLLGRAGPGELQRFTQDAGIVADVWLRFAKDFSQPLRVLVAPLDGVSAIDTAAVLHRALRSYREKADQDPTRLMNRQWTTVAPLESFVALTINFDELLHVVLPLTPWWRDKKLEAITKPMLASGARDQLERYISHRLGDAATPFQLPKSAPGVRGADLLRILEAAPIAALVGLLGLIQQEGAVEGWLPHDSDDETLAVWTPGSTSSAR